MMLAIALMLWVALSAAIYLYLHKTNRPTEPIIAGVVAACLGIAGGSQLGGWQGYAELQTYHDTDYVSSQGNFLLNTSLLYLIAAAIALVILKLARGRTRHLLPPAFWAWHLGAGTVVLTNVLSRFAVPARYIDYPGSIYWFSLVSWFGALLSFAGAVALLVLLGIALVQRALKGRTT